MKALADETRLRILNILYEKELCVCDINETLQITQTKASRHLGYLKNMGLIKGRRNAQWTYYSLEKPASEGFVEKLILENLRGADLYQRDLKNLMQWLMQKSLNC